MYKLTGAKLLFQINMQSTVINDQVCIVGVVCNLIFQDGLYFCLAHHKIDMLAEINILVMGYAFCQFISPNIVHGGKRCMCWNY
jgi:hypothetical protein